jgi:hypothetical protein
MFIIPLFNVKITLKMDWIEKLYYELGSSEPDYYIENGKRVFTKTYHLKRGYCCGSGCRHCPYTNKKKLKRK